MGTKNFIKFGDTSKTKIFVGGLAWETNKNTMKSYFEQFGHVLEAIVIIDKYTGKSKGYGFVIFKDPDSAMRACQNPYPVIDGRKTNCNLASLGAQKRFRKFKPSSVSTEPMAFLRSSTYFYQLIPDYAFSYDVYGCPFFQQDNNTLSYHNVYDYGGQHFVPFSNGYPGVYLGYYYPTTSTSTQGQSKPKSNPKMTENVSHLGILKHTVTPVTGTTTGSGLG